MSTISKASLYKSVGFPNRNDFLCYCHYLFLHDKTLCAQPCPILLNWIDNQTSQAWIKKVATRTPKGKTFQRILCSLMINNPLGSKADFIPGVKNVLADVISCTYSNSSSSPLL